MFRAVASVVALLSLLSSVQAQSSDLLAEQVRNVLATHCAECHGGKQPRADLQVLNVVNLFRRERQLVIPSDPDGSELLQLVECGTMPPGTRPKVPEAQRKILRTWIKAGAQPFPPETSDSYALTKILLDVRAAAAEDRNLADERYVTLNHLLAHEDTTAELNLYRAALSKALNQLSSKPGFVALKPIDPAGTIYRIKLSELGWNVKPFAADPRNGGKDVEPTNVNLFDLLLLEYPLASLPEHSDVGEAVVAEYLAKVKPLRPIPFVRGDWLASVATQPPLYADLLRLPLTFAELEQRLDLGADVVKARAALTTSGILRDNRLVERRSTKQGAYWRTYDLAGKQGLEALLADAGAANPGGGEAIFRLPNGLPGYFIADERGLRLDAIPAAHLGEKQKAEAVTNGLSCMICHDRGLKKVKNAWGNERPPRIKDLQGLYPDDDALGRLLDQDNEGYDAMLRQTLLKLTDAEPLGPVSRRFRQEMTQLLPESKVTLVNLDAAPRKRRTLDTSYLHDERDAPVWMLARGAILSPPLLPPVDARGVPHVAGKDAAVSFALTTVNVNRLAARAAVSGSMVAAIDPAHGKLGANPATIKFQPGDRLAIVVRNTGPQPMHFELIVTDDQSNVIILPVAAGGARMGVLKPDQEFRFAPGGGIMIKPPQEGELAKQRIIVYAAPEAFPAAVVLNQPDKHDAGYSVAGRVVHPLFRIDGKKITVVFDPAKIVRQTIEFETMTKRDG